jgi:hypothetical protein
MAITLPSTTVLPMGWSIGIATDGNKAASVQVNGTSGGHILYPGSGATITSASLAGVNYELLMLQFDGSNFRVIEVTPATATLMGVIGNAPGINRWSFPAVGTYAASQGDSGNALSSFNTPTSSLTVTLPSTTAIGAGWMMGFATDNVRAGQWRLGREYTLPGRCNRHSGRLRYSRGHELSISTGSGKRWILKRQSRMTARRNRLGSRRPSTSCAGS